MRALALVDGEHYPAVVRAAFDELPYVVAGAVVLGGNEKLRDGRMELGVPLHATLEHGLDQLAPDVVVDLSDEPIADPRTRFRLASRALAAGVPYVGSDFRFDPVDFAPFHVPAVAVIGTGKRVGKTAVAGRLARVAAESCDVVVVAMGRGGPPDPVLVDERPTLAALLALSRAGAHAASDYLEDAAFADVATVGCRRCGGGLAGAPFASNVDAGARIAAAHGADLVVLEGSGACIPPVEASARILVAAGGQERDAVVGFLGPYRLLLSDLVVLTMCEPPLAPAASVDALREAIADVNPELPVVATVFKPRPTEPIVGRRVAFFSTASEAAHARLRALLEEEHGAEVVLVSGNLARRRELRRDLGSREARKADVYLVELKGAAIDVVAETASERGVPVVLADNAIAPLAGEPDLDEHLLRLVERACREVPA
ncbi:MAG: 2,3-diphosphoglycerate synthetase [Actinomycetota bacterium]|nr:2,3-diphosphoglycerate synthetase [Actinomycetota bacterium]